MTNDYQSRKCSLRAVLRGPASVERIQDAVRRCDTLWIHCLLFIKGFLLNKYEQDPERARDLPQVDPTFVLNALRTVAGVRVNGGSRSAQGQRQDLRDFYVQHYAPTMPPEEPLTPATHLTQILVYLSKELVVDYENNIKQHWLQHLNLFLNDGLQKKEMLRRCRVHVRGTTVGIAKWDTPRKLLDLLFNYINQALITLSNLGIKSQQWIHLPRGARDCTRGE